MHVPELNLEVICESEGAIDGPDVLQEVNADGPVLDDAAQTLLLMERLSHRSP